MLRAPAVTLGVLAMTLAVSLPIALTLRPAVADQSGASDPPGRVAAGWDAAWALEIPDQGVGLAGTLTHEIVGFGGSLAIASRVVNGGPLPGALAAAVAAYLVLWTFLWGGILDRLARDRPIGAAAFFSACATFFFRFVRLAVAIGLAYWLVLAGLRPWLQVPYGLYAVSLGAAVAIGLTADFARVRAVVEDRRSMAGAVVAGLRFVRRRPLAVMGLYGLNLLALVTVVAAWFFAAPGASVPPALAWLAALLYLLGRLWVRLALQASYLAYFQSELACAGYTASPLPVWPDSPAAEPLDNGSR